MERFAKEIRQKEKIDINLEKERKKQRNKERNAMTKKKMTDDKKTRKYDENENKIEGCDKM